MDRNLRGLPWLALCLTVSACSKGERPGAGTDDAGGARAHGRIDTIKSGPIQVVGSSDSLARVIDLEVLENGAVVVMNSTEPYLISFSPEGAVSWAWGKRGEGPGEFLDPGGLVALAETGDVWAYDQAHRSFTRVGGPTEQHPSFTIQLDSAEYRPPLTQEFPDQRRWMAGVPGGIAMAWPTNGFDMLGLWYAEIKIVQPDGKLRPMFSVGDRLADPATNYQNATELLPYPLWAVCPDQSIALYDPDSNAVRRYRADGQLTQTVALPPEKRLPVSFDQVYRMISREMFDQKLEPGLKNDSSKIKERLRAEWERQRERFWETFPEYYELWCVSDGTLWIQPFDIEPGRMGRGPIWYRIGPGDKISALRLPDDFRPYRITKDRMLGVYLDEDNVESIGFIAIGKDNP